MENNYLKEIKLSKEIDYNGERIEKLSFDFSNLRGEDAIAIENELQRKGKTILVPALSVDYAILLLTRACVQKIGADLFSALPIVDFNAARSIARAFLLHSEE